jgi:hypothetical protein
MQARRKNLFITIRAEGSILPADLLQRIERGERELNGLAPEDYHLPGNEKINEAVSRSWARMLGAWTTFKPTIEKTSDGDTNTSPTRERWLLPLFQELGYGRLIAAKAVEIEGKPYPISHHWQHAPIHLVGSGVDLDTRTAGVAGAAKISPHSLVQEFLNRSEESLWGFVSNGLRLRILRDNVSLTRQAFVEFDLEAMMNGEVYSDFVLLWLLCHESRVEAAHPQECWLERWSRTAQEQGTRALEQLRKGVEEAIKVLGSGFLKHRANKTLKEKLRSQQLSAQDYYRQLLRFVYRLLFLFVAEDRELLLDPKADDAARSRYKRFYSIARLRKLAERRVGTRHADLFVALRLVMQKLGSDAGCAELGLPALGSFLFSPKAMPDIEDCELMNVDMLAAIRALTFITDRHGRRVVDYKNLRSEELGSVYEALLELHPYFDTDAGAFELQTTSGNERKTTGSYYTPESLVQCLLDSALDPVLDEAAKKANAEAAILDLKVCDPACGSGHFLIAAAHRIAKRLAAIRTGDEEPAPDALRKALRDCIGDCIYGVDVNPMAVELCKVSLWMEALEPGKPLSFLEQHIQVGNSLLGTTPVLLEKGIPDDAFKPIEGDDKAICAKFKKLNKEERLGFQRLFKETTAPWDRLGDLGTEIVRLEDIPDDDIKGVRQKEKRYEEFIQSGNYLFTKFWADTWCAAFVWKKSKEFDYPITEDVFRKIEHSPHDVAKWMRDEIMRLAEQYQFFHWHLAFPNVFGVAKSVEEAENQQAGWNGGFDVVLGNPPWERIKLQEKEWFAQRRPDIANTPNAATRERMIRALKDEDPTVFKALLDDRRKAEGESHLVRGSRRYPLCGRGDVNTYAVFAETNLLLINPKGRVGCIVPSGIATDDSTKEFFAHVVLNSRLVSIFDFENRENLFPGIGHGRMKFSLITLGPAQVAKFAFQLWNVADLRGEDRIFELTSEDIRLLNPNTKTCPIFRSSREAALTKHIYSHVPILVEETGAKRNEWCLSFQRMFDMTNDASLFNDAKTLTGSGYLLKGNVFTKEGEPKFLPLYEAKMATHYDHRFGTYERRHESRESTALDTPDALSHQDPSFAVIPRYWVSEKEIPKFRWALTIRAISHATNDRSFITQVIPRSAIGNSMVCVQSGFSLDQAFLFANFCSFVFDFVVRQKMGGLNLNLFIIKQLPAFSPSNYSKPCLWSSNLQTLSCWLLPRVLELTYTAFDLKPFAEDCGYTGEPFLWNEERRFLIRAELDAAYFHLYGISRDDADYILDTFPIVKRKDEQAFGEYRTKRVILEIYDEMQRAIETGQPYRTRLDPPPVEVRMQPPALAETRSLVLPTGKRYSLNDDAHRDDEGYAMLVIRTFLYEEGGSIDTNRLMKAYALLTKPNLLEKYGASVEGNVAHAWRERYCDELKPNVFLVVLYDLVGRGAIKLVRQGDSIAMFWVDLSDFEPDSDIQFDVRFALRVSDSLTEENIKDIPEVATSTDIALLYSATG